MIPTVLSVAGSDPSGGAGIQADLKTFSALGAYGAAVLTALTAQNTRGVTGVVPVSGEFVEKQLTTLFEDLDVHSVKTGMLGSPEVVDAVVKTVMRYRIRRLVVDPVMVATSGDRLVSEETAAAIRDRLLPLAAVITPNLPETAALLGWSDIQPEQMAEAGAMLRDLGASAVVVKGGHHEGPEAIDVLVDAEGAHELRGDRVPTKNTHGTGCTFASAIAVGLANGKPLIDAVADAKAYLTEALRAADSLHVGSGYGPVHHFHALWTGPRRAN
ncbi:bifunctional hydroxymethylpyrimidine kinase/phosphomethylpyrimidine kinase [Phytoactinopolyspora alkaliphila]|uniref:Bifunctional hydroxymethylpyrimidine kinase/phosphomethylpyrimidine kinase n=1 Tax=Phytoactinopolyspora alkaliphila TaxID=1783498 RepID=A0A6N9YSE7_9ACTN|nr:bifunctional hydroxymethylpyrimidine kinase/phosphomethylpyrimidine kinase [Phytoactinopolyspora alkaliphila]NED97966.1 bifunctional hydroxymethylpyrimidine kinase/phosphomethylpyrimidine kinase [Phytoactinopolyspora alkaliphila]